MPSSTPSRRQVLHLISQAHLDPVWLWPWRDGSAEALTTMQSAVDRADEIADFKFTRSSAGTYRWVQEMDPVLFSRIRKLIAAGRWEPVGGWIEQPDCNLPSTESFVRQSLYGKGYFARETKTDIRTGYNVDSFGHSGGLPQLLKKAGFDHYVFMRPHPYENGTLPPIFWWESGDGSRVLTVRVPDSYCQSPATTSDELEKGLREAEKRNFPGGFDDGLFFLGVGNHGGGPTRRHLERVAALQREKRKGGSLPELRFSSLRDYFRALEKSPSRLRSLPVVRGELQHHARGCYSAAGEIKTLNRRAEQGLVAAETLSLIAETGGNASSIRELGEAWWRLLFNQFHDILAGSCTSQVWGETVDRFGGALTVARETAVRAVHTLARRVDTRKEQGSVLFACNPLSWARKALLQCDMFSRIDGRGALITHLEDAHGRRIPIQWAKADAGFGPHLLPWGKLSAVVPLPATGYRTFRLIAAKPEVEARKKAHAIAGLTRRGLVSLKSARGTELLAGPIGLAVFADESDTWSHGVDVLGKALGRPKRIAIETRESGPHLTIIRHRYRWGASDIFIEFIRGGHTEAIELRLRFNWQEKRQILRLVLPTRLANIATLSQAAGGIARRASAPGEEPCQDWVAVEGTIAGKPHTLAVANAASYSYDLAGRALRFIVARSAPFAEHLPAKYGETETLFLDQGWQERRFWIFGFAGKALSRPLHRIAAELQIPAETMLDSGHAGTEPWEKSVLDVSPGAVTTTAWKRAEDGRGSILRLQETTGRKVTARVRFPEAGRTVTVPLGPWEIATFRVQMKKRAVLLEKTDLLERPLRGRRWTAIRLSRNE